MCGPNGECPPGLDCFGGVCRAADPGPDASLTFPLTVTLGGNMNGTVTSNPPGINCGTDCVEQYMSGSMVTLTASPMSGSIFMGWSGACSGTGTCTITVSTAVNVTANFAVDNSLLVTLAGNGLGIVSSNPPGINCGTDCMEQFAPGTMVVLTASPATGSTFDGWTGAGCTGIGTCTVTTDAAKMVTATFSLSQHALTVTKTGNGSGMVASNPAGITCGTDCTEAYAYNTMVTLTATATTGSTFTGWTGGGCTGTSPCTVTMTAATNVSANFTLDTFALTVAKAGAGAGTVSSTPTGITCGTDCTETYDYNTMVTLSATPSTGSTFGGWTGGGCTGTSACTVTMTAATMVTASFALNNYALTATKSGNGSGTVSSNPAGIDCGADCSQSYSFGSMVTLTAMATTGSTFNGWMGGGCTGTSPCTVNVMGATNVDANFTLTTHTLSVNRLGTGTGTITGIGINCGTDCNETVDYNTMITLTATPAPGSSFDGWTGGGCTGTGTCQVTITAMTSVSATFTLSQHLVTVQKTGTGAGTVSSAPAGIMCGTDCNQLYDYNTSVTLTAMQSTGSTFAGWSGGGCSGTGTCVVTVTAATTVQAQFNLNSYALTVSATGGTGTGNVSSSPAGINCGNGGSDCNEPYTHGTQVTLSATPAPGSSFTGWSGAGISCPGTGSCIVDMTAARSVTAAFAPTTTAVTVTKSGTGAGTVTSVPAGINCGTDCSENFTNSTMVTLTATPAMGSTFSGWSGGTCTGTGTCMFTVGSPVTITATFTLDIYTLSVTKNGTGSGGVTSSPSGINCGANCNANYNYNTTVTLTATPSANSNFTGWMGGGCSGTGQCVVTMTAATTVTATFDLIQHSLDVKHIGSGSGTVTSMPLGIDCGADCNEAFNDGQMVMLMAVPDVGSSFVGWQGDCSGSLTTCVVTMDAEKTVLVDFGIAQYLLTVGTNIPGAGTVVSVSDSGIDCGADCSELYDYNTTVQLKEGTALGYTFVGWSGGGCTGTGTCEVTMDAAKSVTANYAVTTYTLTVNRGGNGTGSVSAAPGINCGTDCTEDYSFGTEVDLTAMPGMGSTISWSGCDLIFANTCRVTMDSIRNVTATFTLQTFLLQTSVSGNGQLTSSPAGITCGGGAGACNVSFNYGTVVTLTATPSPGFAFNTWSGDCSGSTVNTCMLTMTAPHTTSASFSVIPPNYVFVTSTTYTGNLGGLSGADTICQNQASAAGLNGTYRAWLSTTTVNAISRLGTARGWIRKDGKPVVDQLSDITSGHFFYPPRQTAAGAEVGANQIWTGTNIDGRYAGAGDCNGWTSNSLVFSAPTGLASANSSIFTQWSTQDCSMTFRFLCFGVDRPAVVAPPVVNARRAFTTNAEWTPGGGLASADALCASEASAAGLAGTYKALLPTTTASAISRFNTASGTLPWARRDNTLMAPTAATLATAGLALLDASPNGNAQNNFWLGNYAIWGGTASLTSVGTAAQTCSNWTSSLSTQTGGGGRAGISDIAGWFYNDSFTCNSTFVHLVCLQQ